MVVTGGGMDALLGAWGRSRTRREAAVLRTVAKLGRCTCTRDREGAEWRGACCPCLECEGAADRARPKFDGRMERVDERDYHNNVFER